MTRTPTAANWLGWTEGTRADAETFAADLARTHGCRVVVRPHDSGGWDAFAVGVAS